MNRPSQMKFRVVTKDKFRKCVGILSIRPGIVTHPLDVIIQISYHERKENGKYILKIRKKKRKSIKDNKNSKYIICRYIQE